MRTLTHFVLWNLDLAEAQTQTSDAERSCLANYASGRMRLAEIGVWHGVSTIQLRKAMAPHGILFAIDHYPAGRLGFSAQQIIAKREVSKITNGSVKWIRKTGADAAVDLKGGPLFDFVFIDGDHSYEGLQGDWTAWHPLMAPGGIVALHDSRSSATRQIDGAGSVRFTRDVILHDPLFEAVDVVDSLTVLRRQHAPCRS